MATAAFILSLASIVVALASVLVAIEAKRAAERQAVATEEQAEAARCATAQQSFHRTLDSFVSSRDFLRQIARHPDFIELQRNRPTNGAFRALFEFCESTLLEPPFQGGDVEIESFLSGSEPSVQYLLSFTFREGYDRLRELTRKRPIESGGRS